MARFSIRGWYSSGVVLCNWLRHRGRIGYDTWGIRPMTILSRTIGALGFQARPRITCDPDEAIEELRSAINSVFGEDTLLERAETLGVIFAHQPILIMTLKRDGEIVSANRFAVDHLRWARARLVGSRYQEFVIAEDPIKADMSDGSDAGISVTDWKTGDGGRRSLLWFCSAWVGDKALAVALPVDLCAYPACAERVRAG